MQGTHCLGVVAAITSLRLNVGRQRDQLCHHVIQQWANNGLVEIPRDVADKTVQGFQIVHDVKDSINDTTEQAEDERFQFAFIIKLKRRKHDAQHILQNGAALAWNANGKRSFALLNLRDRGIQ